MRFLSILLGLTAVCAIIYFTIYYWGLGRPVTSFEHAFDLRGKPYVITPWDADPKTMIGATDVGPGTPAVWLDVYRDGEGLLRVLPSARRPLAQDPLPPKIDPPGPLLGPTLDTLGNVAVILNVLSNATDIDQQIAKEFEARPQAKVLLTSEYDNVMSATKIQKPLWSYGTSASDRVRFLTFESIGLLPAVTVPGDVYIAPLKVRKLNAVNAGIVGEAHRRKMSVILGPLATADEVREAQSLNADGYFLTTPEALAALKNP